jgi:hypothetical protein
MKLIKFILVSLLISMSIKGIAQEQDKRFNNALVTDRPDATEASSTVGKGVFQIETGGFYESFEENNIKLETFTYNTMLLRYGLLERLEFRVGWDFVEGITKVDGNKLDNVTSGFSPLLLGVKIDITEEKGALPEIALLLHTNHLFFAGNDFKSASVGTDFRFSLSHTLSERSSLGYNIGMSWDGDTTRETYLYTIAYGYSFNDKIGAYAELYGEIPGGLKFSHFWNAGFTYLASKDLQFDAYFGSSLTEGQDILLGLGASFRVLPTSKKL